MKAGEQVLRQVRDKVRDGVVVLVWRRLGPQARDRVTATVPARVTSRVYLGVAEPVMAQIQWQNGGGWS